MTNSKTNLAGSFLISGSDKDERKKMAEEIIGNLIKIDTQTNNPDFFLIDSETSIGIETIRNLQKDLSLKPFSAEKKIVFIKEAQNLTIEAQNALLKTLEEPPMHTLIILSSPNPYWLLPTVVSRCRIISLTARPEAQRSINQEKDLSFLNKLMQATIPQRFNLLEEQGIAKDRTSSQEWIDKTIFVVRTAMIRQKLFKPAVCLKLLKLLSKTKSYLEANCNVRLAIEVFLIDFPSGRTPISSCKE